MRGKFFWRNESLLLNFGSYDQTSFFQSRETDPLKIQITPFEFALIQFDNTKKRVVTGKYMNIEFGGDGPQTSVLSIKSSFWEILWIFSLEIFRLFGPDHEKKLTEKFKGKFSKISLKSFIEGKLQRLKAYTAVFLVLAALKQLILNVFKWGWALRTSD